MSKTGSSLSSPLAVRFDNKTMELLRLATMAPGDYNNKSLADIIREAVEEKVERENLWEKYEPLVKAMEKMKEREVSSNN